LGALENGLRSHFAITRFEYVLPKGMNAPSVEGLIIMNFNEFDCRSCKNDVVLHCLNAKAFGSIIDLRRY